MLKRSETQRHLRERNEEKRGEKHSEEKKKISLFL